MKLSSYMPNIHSPFLHGCEQISAEFCTIIHVAPVSTKNGVLWSLSPQNGYQGRKGIETAMVLWRSARKTDNDSTPRFSGLRHALQSPRKNNKDRQGTSRSKNVSSMRGSKDLGQENTSQQYIHSETDPCPSFLFINLFFPYVFFPVLLIFHQHPLVMVLHQRDIPWYHSTRHKKAPEDNGKDAVRMRS